MRAAAFLIVASLTVPKVGFAQNPVDCVKDLKEAVKVIDTYWSFLIAKPGAVHLERWARELLPEAVSATTPDACADVLERFMAQLQDGHSSLQYYPDRTVRTKPKIVFRSFRERIVARPGDRARVRVFVVSRDTTDSTLIAVKPGSEVLRIDDAPVDSVYWHMHDRISGSTEWWRDHLADLRLLLGPAETEVRLTVREPDRTIGELTIRRPPDPYGGDEKKRREAAREARDTFTVAESKVLEGGWGYIRLRTFAWKSPRETVQKFDRELAEMLDRPGLVLDLRDNHGGYVDALLDIAGRFLPSRTVMAFMQLRRPGSRYAVSFSDPKRGASGMPPLHAEPRKPVYAGPVVVLVNAGCFSACEVMTGGLQSIGRVRVLGSSASGGGSGTIEGSELPSGAIISFSFFISWRPDGTQIEHNGVDPDIKVREYPSDWREGKDRMLEKAIELLETGRAPTLADAKPVKG